MRVWAARDEHSDFDVSSIGIGRKGWPARSLHVAEGKSGLPEDDVLDGSGRASSGPAQLVAGRGATGEDSLTSSEMFSIFVRSLPE